MLLGGEIIIAQLIAVGLVLLIAMTVHEFAHNYIGYRMGDLTPLEQGRLTLNPMKHIYWPGWLMWVVIGFGILGSAPINANRMRDRRWGYFWAVFAGPLSNLGLAGFAAILYRLNLFEFDIPGPREIIPTFNQFMTYFFQFNLLLFVFNLIPAYPLDGWHMLLRLLPPKESYMVAQYERQVFAGFMIVIFLGFFLPSLNIIGWIINPPYSFLSRLLLGL